MKRIELRNSMLELIEEEIENADKWNEIKEIFEVGMKLEDDESLDEELDLTLLEYINMSIEMFDKRIKRLVELEADSSIIDMEEKIYNALGRISYTKTDELILDTLENFTDEEISYTEFFDIMESIKTEEHVLTYKQYIESFIDEKYHGGFFEFYEENYNAGPIDEISIFLCRYLDYLRLKVQLKISTDELNELAYNFDENDEDEE